MSTSGDSPKTVGGHALATVREHWIRAATYDATCSRYGDGLVRRDEIAKNTTTALSAVTTLGVFGSLFTHNPSLLARLVVFLISATITAVAAIRKQGEWVSMAIRLKERGVEWNRQRNLVGDVAQMILDGRSVAEDMRQRLSGNESNLLENHPRVPNRVYDQMKARKKQEFDEIYGKLDS